MNDRFMPKVEKAENGCWNWTASKNFGYGAFRHRVLKQLVSQPKG